MTDHKKAQDVFEKSKGVKGCKLSGLENSVGAAVVEAASHLEGESKKFAQTTLIHKVQEVSYAKDKSFILIVVCFRYNKVLTCPAFKKFISELEKRLKKTVLVISHRKIQSRWIKENRKLTRPNSRTLTDVFAAILNELLLPGIIISSRERISLDGTKMTKIICDKNDQHFMDDRVEAIIACYRKLTTRNIEITFQKEPTFYTLKKGEKR